MGLLPIGSVVLLEGGEKRLVIIGIMQQNSSDGRIYDYMGCLYPEGYIDEDSLYLFNHKDIKTVDFLGFADAEYQAFRAAFYEELKKEGMIQK